MEGRAEKRHSKVCRFIDFFGLCPKSAETFVERKTDFVLLGPHPCKNAQRIIIICNVTIGVSVAVNIPRTKKTGALCAPAT